MFKVLCMRVSTISTMLVVLFFAGTSMAYSQATDSVGEVNFCDFIGPICEAIGIEGNDPDRAWEWLSSRGQFVISALFVGITLLAIGIIILSGVKYIQSQGNQEKILEAQRAIKAVFLGLISMVVGVVGVLLMISFLGGDCSWFGLNCKADPAVSQCVRECRASGRSLITCQVECADGKY